MKWGAPLASGSAVQSLALHGHWAPPDVVPKLEGEDTEGPRMKSNQLSLECKQAAPGSGPAHLKGDPCTGVS